MNLFAWQKSCLESWRNHGTHGIISVVTGAGKTVFALAAAEELLKQYPNAVRIRIIVPTTALLRQWKKEILAYFPDLPEEEIGVYYASVKSDPDRLFMIYVVNSARYAVSRHILDGMRENKHQLLICDECHRYTGESNRLIFAFKDHPDFQGSLYHSLGMSATPRNTLYEEVLVPALGSEIYHYGTREARRDDHIAPLALVHVSVPLKPSELQEYADLERKIRRLHRELLKEYPELKGKSIDTLFKYLSAFIEDDPDGLPALYCKLILKRREIVLLASCRIDCTIDLLQRMNKTDRAIIFCDRITQAEKIYDIALHTLHLKAGHYHSEMTPEMRKIQLESFRSGEFRMLVTCKALDEGLNVPDAAVGIVVSSSKNERQRIQRLGRILRKNKDKKAVLYYLHTNMPADRLQYLNELAEDTTTADMEYLPGEHDFYCDAYVARAEYIRNQNAFPKNKAAEFMRCINEGNGKADWLLSEELYQNYIQNAETRKERNYWMVMQWLSKADPSSAQKK